MEMIICYSNHLEQSTKSICQSTFDFLLRNRERRENAAALMSATMTFPVCVNSVALSLNLTNALISRNKGSAFPSSFPSHSGRRSEQSHFQRHIAFLFGLGLFHSPGEIRDHSTSVQ